MLTINRKKPVISYFKSGNPTINYGWVSLLTEINVIQTKSITDEFINVCIQNKNKIFIHLVITGMGKSALEPNIDSVKKTFLQLRKLIDNGFPEKQILVVVSPILPNDNGLRALELLLRVFTEFKMLRLRYVRFNLLHYKSVNTGPIPEYITKQVKEKFVVANDNILKRPSTKTIIQYLVKTPTFIKDYFKLLKKYETIISIDNSIEPLIGVRELMPFGYNNSWINEDGTNDKLIHYEKGNKFKPIVNIISNKNPVRCSMRCLLCAHKQ